MLTSRGPGINAEPEPPAVTDSHWRAGGRAAPPAARGGQRDTSQSADGTRDGHRHLADHYVGSGTSARKPELRPYSRQVPAYRLPAALPSQHVSLVFEPPARSGITLLTTAQLAADHLAAYWSASGRQAAQQCLPIRLRGSPWRIPRHGIYAAGPVPARYEDSPSSAHSRLAASNTQAHQGKPVPATRA